MKTPEKAVYISLGPAILLILVGIVLILRTHLPTAPVSLVSSNRSKGAADAPIQILEYSDFQCPACKIAQSTLTQLLKQYPGKIKIVYMHFPLDAHRWSPMAHRAAECAAREQRFWEFHDHLYAEQDQWSKKSDAPIEEMLSYAKESGVKDLNRFALCLGSNQTDETIYKDRDSGIGLGVRSTPSFFVNGELAVGSDDLAKKIAKRVQ